MEDKHSQQRSISSVLPVALVVAIIFLGAGLSLAAEQGPKVGRDTDKPTAQGMRAFIDPATGKLRGPTEEEQKEFTPRPALRSMAITSVAKPEKAGPGGAVGIALDESYMVHSVATKNPDGTISMKCVTGKDEAEKALNGTTHPESAAGKEALHEK